jgi:hypothetical protein
MSAKITYGAENEGIFGAVRESKQFAKDIPSERLHQASVT